MLNHEIVCLFEGSHVAYPAGDKVARYIYEGWFEANEMAFVSQFLAEGDTVFDLGAHAGLYSVLALGRVGGTGQIIACEPNPKILPWLEKNLETAAISKPAPVSAGARMIVTQGISDSAGVADFYLGVRGSTAYASLQQNEFTDEKASITLTSFDDLVAATGVDKINLVKVDIEGAEARFLAGAQKAVAAHPEIVILMEFSEDNQNRFGESTQSLLMRIEAAGLKAFDVDIAEQSVRFLDFDQPLWHKNLVLAHDKSIIERRLEAADSTVKINAINEAKRGRAALRLYEEGLRFQALNQRIEEPIRRLTAIVSLLSNDARPVQEFARLLSADMASDETRAGLPAAMIDFLDDVTGRLAGAAQAVHDRLKSEADEKQETLASLAKFMESFSAIAKVGDEISGSSNNTMRLRQAIKAVEAGDSPAQQLAAFRAVAEDEIGRLAGAADALGARLKNEADERRQTLESLAQFMESFSAIGDVADRITGSNDNSAHLRQAIEEGELHAPPAQRIATLRSLAKEEINRLAVAVDELMERLAANATKLELAARDRRKMKLALHEVQALGELALGLQRSRLIRAASRLGLPAGRAVAQMVEIYCGTVEEPVSIDEALSSD